MSAVTAEATYDLRGGSIPTKAERGRIAASLRPLADTTIRHRPFPRSRPPAEVAKSPRRKNGARVDSGPDAPGRRPTGDEHQGLACR
jgi:hypothetical protein